MNSDDLERSLEDITNGLPEGWASAQVRELMNLINGYPFKPSQWKDDGLPIIRIQNLNNPDAPFNYCSDDIPKKYLIKNRVVFSVVPTGKKELEAKPISN